MSPNFDYLILAAINGNEGNYEGPIIHGIPTEQEICITVGHFHAYIVRLDCDTFAVRTENENLEVPTILPWTIIQGLQGLLDFAKECERQEEKLRNA